MKLTTIALLGVAAISPAVYAASDMDHKIEDAARSSYNYRTVLDGKVSVEAQDGVVTLTGTVTDSDLKTLAEDTVRNLPGVTRVDDQITVAPAAPEHSDRWVAFKVNSLLLLKADVSATNTHVAVTNGRVTLTGTADTMAQKELTGDYVKDVEGVTAVDNQLVVRESPATERNLGEYVDDASITAQVKYELLAHRSTSALRTKVSTRDGVVAIEGEAGSTAEKTLVTRLVQGIRGVKSVRNSMTVRE